MSNSGCHLCRPSSSDRYGWPPVAASTFRADHFASDMPMVREALPHKGPLRLPRSRRGGFRRICRRIETAGIRRAVSVEPIHLTVRAVST